MSQIKLRLQKISKWVSTLASAAGDTVEFSVKSGFLQDTLSEICDRAGVAGAVFKLGAMAIPKADAETRIAARITRAFVETLDERLGAAEQFISEAAWKRYQRDDLEEAARLALRSQFTWLSVIGGTGLKSSRSWPLVHELSDLARRIVWETARIDADEPGQETRQFADDVQGSVHRAIARCVDEFANDPVIVTAFNVEMPTARREVLELLAEQFSTLDQTHLFGEVPQNALFVPPRIRVADYSETDVETDWDKLDLLADGDQRLLEMIARSAGCPDVFVVTGEMGVGKSCLLRTITAELARRYVSSGSDAVLFANWRDIYQQGNLTEAIARHMDHEHRLPVPELSSEKRLVLVIDGFDEMRSHDPSTVGRLFDSLVKLARDHASPLVLAMRSTITGDLQQQWKNEDVVVVKVEEFGVDDTDKWAQNWCEFRAVTDISGELLRGLCSGVPGLAQNPLLLFMLARYVAPSASAGEKLSRTQIFRRFVNETINGKARQSGKPHPAAADNRNYRFLLQEIAWVASWPRHGGKCPLSVIRERCGDTISDDLSLEDARSAFVLHFFEPGEHHNEFEFHPEAFRHYLLAEWCVRTHCETVLFDSRAPGYVTGRKRAEAVQALSQFPLREMERELMAEICEELLPVVSSDEQNPSPGPDELLATLGLPPCEAGPTELVSMLVDHLTNVAADPPNPGTVDQRIGIPSGHVTTDAMQPFRLLVTYWDHIAIILSNLSNSPWNGQDFVSQMLFGRRTVGISDRVFLARADLRGTFLSGAMLYRANLHTANLSGAKLYRANLREANLAGADLCRTALRRATLEGADLRNTYLDYANLFEADLRKASLSKANLPIVHARGANLSGANLSGANLRDANLRDANLRDANLRGANLHGADLSRADLSRADLSDADLSDAEIDLAILSASQRKSIAVLPDGSKPGSKSE